MKVFKEQTFSFGEMLSYLASASSLKENYNPLLIPNRKKGWI